MDNLPILNTHTVSDSSPEMNKSFYLLFGASNSQEFRLQHGYSHETELRKGHIPLRYNTGSISDCFLAGGTMFATYRQ